MIPTIEQETTYIFSFQSDQATLAAVGGKGANLARLAQAGLPVPSGFLVSTRAYGKYLEANGLREKLASALAEPIPTDPDRLEGLSTRIRALFTSGEIPGELAALLQNAYIGLGEPPVAVRSSATAEDLPDMSFAGQQDTYLNVVGREALLKAVIDCWASLWTARAIGYRARNGIPQADVSLAVVVQSMVESQASGVLFTANPLTGLRTEMVIDATLGLGEALVSGQVEPDHYVVDAEAGKIISKTIGAKAISVRSQAGGGTSLIQEDSHTKQALADAQILDLVRLGQQVVALYQFPQDIEWAWASDRLYLLQSRPITSLFPIPEGMVPEVLKVFISFAAVQGMLDPVTPLGRDMLDQIAAVASGLFGIRVTAATQTFFLTAGERLWVNLTPLMRNRIGRSIMPTIFALVEPSVGQAIQTIRDDPRLQPGEKTLSLRAISRLVRIVLPMLGNILLNLLAPGLRRRVIVGRGERTLRKVRADCAAIQGDKDARLAQLAGVFSDLGEEHLATTFLMFVSGVASGMAAFNILNAISKKSAREMGAGDGPGENDLVLEITRGVPNNPTTDMDLALWQVALIIQQDAPSQALFIDRPTAELVALYRAGGLPAPAQQALSQFLERYGGRGFGEIDAGRPRWSEEPAHVFEVIIGYLHIADPDRAPTAVYARSVDAASEAVDRLAARVRKSRGGWAKEKAVRFAAGRARALLGLRESPKFFAVRMFGILRQNLLAIGGEYAQAGELTHPDDLIYLSLAELGSFAASAAGSVDQQQWRDLIHARREAYQRELRRRQIPRLLLSDGRAFYEGMHEITNASGTLSGSPVSPGSVEGRVRVVLDPRHAELQPGEILVCPGTDPSWTPLFLTAAGLVLEVGGMMTHGAVVAREYGIPAIVGVDQATRRLRTGALIRMDGSTGMIALVEETQPSSTQG
jgi:rifampicin phosphotransferase